MGGRLGGRAGAWAGRWVGRRAGGQVGGRLGERAGGWAGGGAVFEKCALQLVAAVSGMTGGCSVSPALKFSPLFALPRKCQVDSTCLL